MNTNITPEQNAWAEAAARELVSYNYHAESLKKGGTYEKELNAHLAIILKFAPPDLTAEVARLSEALAESNADADKWCKRANVRYTRIAQLEAALPGVVKAFDEILTRYAEMFMALNLGNPAADSAFWIDGHAALATLKSLTNPSIKP